MTRPGHHVIPIASELCDRKIKAGLLLKFTTDLFQKAGLSPTRAATVAEILLEGDLLGHHTHGLALAPAYLRDLRAGRLRSKGRHEVVHDGGSVLVWDGRRLPGPWLVDRAIASGIVRAKRHGTATIVIRRSHHIGCLAAYCRKPAEMGFVILLMSSDPSVVSVAPFGGTGPVYTPDPVAFGYPTKRDPVIIDVSMSITTNGLVARCEKDGKRLPGKWLVDPKGRASDDPSVLSARTPGALLPMGGTEYGHKGFALGLLVETLTQGLSGFGRAEPAEGWGASVYVQIFDPDRFAGREAFTRQTDWLAEACRNSRPASRGKSVRLPGQAALERRRRSLRSGVTVPAGAISSLVEMAREAGVSLPKGII